MRLKNAIVLATSLLAAGSLGCSGTSGPSFGSPTPSGTCSGTCPGGGGAGGGGGGGDAGGGRDGGGDAGQALNDASVSPPDAAVSPLATLSGFCAARAAAECSAAVLSACALTSQSACRTVRLKACLASVPPGTTYQPSEAAACLAAVTETYATSTVTPAALAAEATACGPTLFAGAGTPEAPCSTDYDCDSAMNLSCIVPTPIPSSGMGECLVPNVVSAGGDCSPKGSVCTGGTYCDPAGLVCDTDAPLYAGCNPPDGYPCAAGLVCQDTGSPFATCIVSQNGTACQTATDCSSNLCDTTVGDESGQCAASITLSPTDSMCRIFQ
jgi:hypothetical protein